MTVVDELVALLGYDIQNEDDLKRFNASLDNLEKKAYNVGKAMGRFAAVASAAVGGAFAFLGKGVIDTSAKFETYLATLETITGSSEKAKAAMDWVKDFAKTTPYEVDELTQAFVKLSSYGLDPMDGMMTVLGDTAAGMGKSIDQVVEAMADATTFQFERLRELGLVASQAGDEVTFSWTENGKSMEKTIKKTSAEVTRFITEVWDRKFSGAMIRQAKTWTGMVSALGDTWTEFQLKIGEAGFFDTVKEKVAQLADTLSRWMEDGTIDTIAKSLGGAFTTAANVVGAVSERLAAHIGFIAKNFETLEPWIKAIGVAFGALLVTAFPITSIFVGLAFVLDEILSYMEGSESKIGDFIKWLQEVTGVSEEVAEALTGLAGVVGGSLLLAFTLAPATMGRLAARLVTGLGAAIAAQITAMFAGTAIAGSISSGIATAFALASNPVGWGVAIGLAVSGLIYYFRDDLKAKWQELKPTIDGLIASFKDWFANISLYDIGASIINSLLSGLKSAWQGVVSWYQNNVKFDAIDLNVKTGGGTQPNTSSPAAGAAGARGGGQPGTVNPNPAQMHQNFQKNSSLMNPTSSAASTLADNRQTHNNVRVNAPVTVQVREATDAPAAVGNAVGNAVQSAALPSRMQTGPAA